MVCDTICAIGDLNDLRPHTRVRLSSSGFFEKIPPAGEIPNMLLTDSGSYTVQGDTYARIIVLTREMVINDDLGGFLQLPKIVGRDAARTKEKLIFELILSNPSSFFGSGNANYLSGAGSALAQTSLTTAAKLFREQKDPSGNLLLQVPRMVMVPSALEEQAMNLYHETTVAGDAQGTNSNDAAGGTPHLARYRPVVAPYLGTAGGLASASDTGWYLLGNPRALPAFEVAYVGGKQFPAVEVGRIDFNSLNIAYRAVYDWGFAFADYRGGVFSAGV